MRITSLFVREALLVGVAVVITYLASSYLEPWYVSNRLSAGIGPTGWPFAYWMKIWVEWGDKGYEQQVFDYFFLIFDVLLFYAAIHLAMFIAGRTRVRQ